MKVSKGVALCSVLVSLWACPRNPQDPNGSGGDATGGKGGSAASDSSDERLDELSRSELQSLCQDLNLELSTRFDNRRLATYECTRSYIRSGNSLSCNQGVNECLRDSDRVSLGAPRPPDFQLDNTECAGIGTCRLSVGVLDACLADRFDQSDQLMARLSCNLANDPGAVEALLAQIDSPRQLPQSCAAVAANCPGLL